MRLADLDRVPNANSSAVEAYIRRGQPVVIPGVARDWAARAWTMADLEARCGGNSTYWEHYPTDRSRLGWWDIQTGTVRDFLARMRRGDAVYLPGNKIGEDFPQLGDDVAMPPCIAADRHLPVVDRYRLFIGDSQRTEIHYLPYQSVLVHLSGAPRKIVLYPPSQTSKLYPFRWFEQVHMSRVLPDRVADFPRFRNVDFYEHEIAPGDGVYIPVHWWHSEQSVGESLAVQVHFERLPRDKFDRRLDLRYRAALLGERVLEHRPRLAKLVRRFAERTAWGS